MNNNLIPRRSPLQTRSVVVQLPVTPNVTSVTTSIADLLGSRSMAGKGMTPDRSVYTVSFSDVSVSDEQLAEETGEVRARILAMGALSVQ